MPVPIYFAYGANMDIEAMRQRCPASKPLGPARLMDHRFFIMRDGVASVRRSAGAVVHGLLWDLALADVRSLDRFEEVERRLYSKILQPVLRQAGSVQALLYVGHTTQEGPARPGYLEAVIASAQALDFPAPYLRALAARCPGGYRNTQQPDVEIASWPGLQQGARPAVRPRFATPFDRS